MTCILLGPGSLSMEIHTSHLRWIVWWSGLVIKSAGFSMPGMWCMLMSWWFTTSLIKWAWILIYFMCECNCGSCVHAMVPWLSQYSKVVWVWWKHSSSNSDHCQRICHAQCEHTIYSALQDNNAMMTCCLELQAMIPPLHLMRKPDMLFHPLDIAQSESANALNDG